MWDDWLCLLCGGGVCVWDDWLGLLCGGVCVCGMTGLVSCVVVCLLDDWLGLLCSSGVCVG